MVVGVRAAVALAAARIAVAAARVAARVALVKAEAAKVEEVMAMGVRAALANAAIWQRR